MEAEKERDLGLAERTKGHSDRAGRQIGGVSAGERVGVTIEHTQEECLMAKQSQTTTTRGCMKATVEVPSIIFSYYTFLFFFFFF